MHHVNVSCIAVSKLELTTMDLSGIPGFDPSNVVAGERHLLQAEDELRLELNFPVTNKKALVQLTLQKGSCELQGVELALHKKYILGSEDAGGGMKLALFTWHGAVIDVVSNYEGIIEMSYISDETACNIAYVNTHAQLEVLRDECVNPIVNSKAENENGSGTTEKIGGPCVLVCGPKESGKSSLVRLLTAYACKVGRTPIVVDLDPSDNGISVPGTLSACPFDNAALTVEMYAQNSMTPSPVTSNPNPTTATVNSSNPDTMSNVATPLVLWHGNIFIQDDLYKAQCSALAEKIQQRFEVDEGSRSSGIIVNTNASIQEEKGYALLLHTIKVFQINVVLVLGHDRLYSTLKNTIRTTLNDGVDGNANSSKHDIHVIKVPRSGGVVSRDNQYLRQCRSRAVKRYFYGNTIEVPTSNPTTQPTFSAVTHTSDSIVASTTGPMTITDRVPQLTPFLIQISFAKLTLYKLSSINLSASLLPVAAAQATEKIQLQAITTVTEKLQHTTLAVCHPHAVNAYNNSGRAQDLYKAGVAGIVAVERVIIDTEMIHLLAPCAGTLPSSTLLIGENLTWMD